MAPSQRSIAILGAGNIGSGFAVFLARAGHRITLIARPGSVRLQQLRRDGGVKTKEGEVFPMVCMDALNEDEPYDFVIVTVLAHQVDGVLPALRRSKAVFIEFMFNVFNPERIKAELGDRPCAFGMPLLLAKIDENGVLDVRLHWEKNLHGDRRCVELFNEAGIPSQYEEKIHVWLRCNAPVCMAIEGVCITAEQHQSGATWAESMLAARALHAGLDIVKQLGFEIYPTSKSRLYSCPAWLLGFLFWMMTRSTNFRKLLASASSECAALTESMVADAVSSGINQALIDALKKVAPKASLK